MGIKYTPANLDATDKGTPIRVMTAKGQVTGTFVSVNSKGINLMVDGKLTSRAVSSALSVDYVTQVTDADQLAHDGMTTRELAAIVGTEPKALRVALRALGLGVGKGRKYNLPAATLDQVKAHLAG
jgi:hypothetical protein